MQEALKKQEVQLMATIAKKQEEQQVLHLDKIGAMQKKIDDLIKQEAVKTEEVQFMATIAMKQEEQRALHLSKVEAMQKKIDDLIKQEAVKKEEVQFMATIAMKQEEQRALDLSKVEAMQGKINALNKHLEATDGDYVNRQGFWRSSWKCLICRKKTSSGGLWTCPGCNLRQMNVGREA
ncbi:MAG: hypothetical protein Q9181_008121 [Wetmoreana brouardii]